VKSAFSVAMGLVKRARYGRQEYIQLLKLIYDILDMARNDGVLATEKHIENPEQSKIFNK
jgi:chemotaxis protein MotA